MPTLSEFYGIKITMRYSDHLPAHIHVVHDEHEAMVSISNGEILRGTLKPHAMQLVAEWIKIHKEELEQAWETQEISKIEPLE